MQSHYKLEFFFLFVSVERDRCRCRRALFPTARAMPPCNVRPTGRCWISLECNNLEIRLRNWAEWMGWLTSLIFSWCCPTGHSEALSMGAGLGLVCMRRNNGDFEWQVDTGLEASVSESLFVARWQIGQGDRWFERGIVLMKKWFLQASLLVLIEREIIHPRFNVAFKEIFSSKSSTSTSIY